MSEAELSVQEAEAILRQLARDLAPALPESPRPAPPPPGEEPGHGPPAPAARPDGPPAGKVAKAPFLAGDKLQALLEAVPDALVVVNRDGLILLVNARTEELFGYRRDELLGRPVEALVPERFRDRHVPKRDGYFREPRVRPMGQSLELFGRRRDGQEFPVEISLSPLEADGGTLAISTVRDIRPRKRAEALLRKAEARYRTLVEGIPAVTFLAALDEGANELYVSPQIEALLGFSQREWLENPVLWYMQLHPDDRPRWHEEFAQTCVTGKPFRAEYRFIARDGRVVWVLGEAKVVCSDDGRPLFMQGIAFDITLMKQAEEQLRAHKEELERLVAERTGKLQEKIEELGHFSHFAGHELKKPLSHIRNEMADPMVLTRGRQQAAVRAMAAWVSSKAQDGLDRIEAMMRWAKLEDRHTKPLVPYDCRDVFAKAYQMLAEAIAETGARVSSGPLPRVLAYQADRDATPELVFLFENLINNGLKYRSPSRPPRIHVAAQWKRGHWEFSFQDNGIGIEAKYFDGSARTQIFNMFDRLHSESKIPGHGIGLAYCKRVVEGLGGKIWVESTVGQGSTFRFTLPALPDDRAVEPAAGAEPPDAGPPPAADAPTAPSTRTKPGQAKAGRRPKPRSKDVPRSGRGRN
jgi:PAS domain S-box-containing protein